MDETKKLIRTLSKSELDKNIKKQLEFFKQIYPYLNDHTFHEECMEVRPKLQYVVDSKKTYFRSMNLWRLDQDGIDRYTNYFEKLNGQAVCMYYSGFSMNYHIQVLNSEGKPYEKGKINSVNSVFTQILPMDFDSVDHDQFLEYIKKINDIGFETINIFSGHGYQALILLDKPVYDKLIFEKFTELLLRKGFPVDPKIKDSARVLRLPYTFNYKYIAEGENPIGTYISQNTNERYSLETVFREISDAFKDVLSPSIDKTSIISSNREKNGYESDNASSGTEINNQDDFGITDNKYNKIIKFDSLPEPIKEMLGYTPEGLRNSVLYFLVPFFRYKIGCDKLTVIKIMKLWSKKCKPSLDLEFVESEVNRLWYMDYKAPYTADLAKEYGFLNFDIYRQADTEITIDNVLFAKYSNIHESAVRIYMIMKIEEHLNKIKEWRAEDIMERACIKKNTFYKFIKVLLDSRLVYKIENKYSLVTGSEKYIYYINNKRTSYGYTKIDINRIENIYFNERSKLNNTEAKVFFLFVNMLNNNSSKTIDCSQEYIGKKVGKSRTAINAVVKELDRKRYVEKTLIVENHDSYCIYELLR